MHKMCDFYFKISVGPDCWPIDMHESLICAVALPFIRSPPWQLGKIPKIFKLVRELQGLLKTDTVAAGDLLIKFLLFCKRLLHATRCGAENVILLA